MSTALPNSPMRIPYPFSTASNLSNSAPENSACSRSNSAMTSSVRGMQPAPPPRTWHCVARTPWSDTLDRPASKPAPDGCGLGQPQRLVSTARMTARHSRSLVDMRSRTLSVASPSARSQAQIPLSVIASSTDCQSAIVLRQCLPPSSETRAKSNSSTIDHGGVATYVGTQATRHVDLPRVARYALPVRFQAQREPLLELEKIDTRHPYSTDLESAETASG